MVSYLQPRGQVMVALKLYFKIAWLKVTKVQPLFLSFFRQVRYFFVMTILCER